MKKIKLLISLFFLVIISNTSNAQIMYWIDSITVNPQFTTQENIPIRIDGKILSTKYGVGDSILNIMGDTVFIFIEFKDGFGTTNDNWTVVYNLPPLAVGHYIIKCTAQILIPLHYESPKIDSFQVVNPSGISNKISNTKNYFLQNYPNPANNSTTIRFRVDKSDFYDLIIYDYNGKEVKSVRKIWYEKGEYSIPFDLIDMVSGIYFYTLKSNQFYQTNKLVIRK